MLKTIAKEKKKLMTIKIDSASYDEIERKAKLYTGGNVSEWVRYASMRMTPKKCDLASPEPKKRGDA